MAAVRRFPDRCAAPARRGTGAGCGCGPRGSRHTAQEPTAAGGATGRFIITRAGTATSALQVFLSTGGTATNGVDCPPLPTSVLIPAGAFSVEVPVTACTDSLTEGPEAVRNV